MITIRQATLPEDRPGVEELFGEYLRWACPRLYQEYAVAFDAENILAHDIETLAIFIPPQGMLLLAFEDRSLAGCACTRKIGDTIVELKRMYVRPHFRRRGIGRLLVDETVKRVSRAGYAVLRLDSAGFMVDAHALYRACGFRARPPYNESEIPAQYRQYWVFMELDLTGSI